MSKKAEQYPKVTVKSERRAKNGRVVMGQSGPGTILSDDVDTVHIITPEWWGEWPVPETDVAMLRQMAAERDRRQQRIDKEAAERGSMTTRKSYSMLLAALRTKNPSIPDVSAGGPVVNESGDYIRLPTEAEYLAGYDDLVLSGKVRP